MANPHTNGQTLESAAAVDVALFAIQDETLKVLLVKRPEEPFRGAWALPGGMVSSEESVDDAALRELQDKTNIGSVYLEQLYTFGEPTRDPRGRVISIAYYALVNAESFKLRTQGENKAAWFPVKKLPSLAFDHHEIVVYALERLRSKINYTTVGFQLLPNQFTLSELQSSYEVILEQALDKRNFRRKMLQLGILKPTAKFKTNGLQRPAQLYTFTKPRVVTLQEKGIIVPF